MQENDHFFPNIKDNKQISCVWWGFFFKLGRIVLISGMHYSIPCRPKEASFNKPHVNAKRPLIAKQLQICVLLEAHNVMLALFTFCIYNNIYQ